MKRRRLWVEALEPRLVLQGQPLGPPDFVDSVPPGPPDVPPDEPPPVEAPPSHDGFTTHTEGTNWLDPSLPFGHNRHVDHVTWDANPTADGLVTVTVLIHDHDGAGGDLDADELARINAAIDEVNSAHVGSGASGEVLLNLVTVTDPNAFHNIHVHEDTTSGCGGTALGCAEYAVYVNHTGTFSDGHGNHLFAGEDVSGGRAEVTVLSRDDWYTGAGLGIGPTEYDYQTVVTQELLHLVGLEHDSTIYGSDPETLGNTDRRSVMHGTLGTGIVRRLMSTHDQEVLKHLYGPGQAGSGGDGGGGGGGPPPGKGKNKVSDVSAIEAEVVVLGQYIPAFVVNTSSINDSRSGLGQDVTDLPAGLSDSLSGNSFEPAPLLVLDRAIDAAGQAIGDWSTSSSLASGAGEREDSDLAFATPSLDDEPMDLLVL